MLVETKVIEQAINQVDPLGLLAAGAPEDEFEGEITEVWERITDLQEGEIPPPEAIEAILHGTFKVWFGEAYYPAPGLWTEAAKAIVANIVDIYTHHYRN